MPSKRGAGPREGHGDSTGRGIGGFWELLLTGFMGLKQDQLVCETSVWE